MITWKFNNLALDVSDTFIYEVDLYFNQENIYCLEDTKLYSSKIYIKDAIDFSKYIYSDFKLFKFTTLISAPLNWLEKNAKLIEYTTQKEKNKLKRKKNELQN